ncbi:hypothetical protein [Enterococcus sp. AZ109]|uniref:hypothetical protein n=1 Tax=Enterococcus sp. AZ109 TaxID=2774634 RepID=UPI003F29A527
MKKNRIKVLSMIVLILSTYLIGIFSVMPEKVSAADSLDEYVIIKNFRAEKHPDGGTELAILEEMKLSFKFEIDLVKMGENTPNLGDQFRVSIPSEDYFDYYDKVGTLKNEQGISVFNYEVIGNEIIFTVAEGGDGASDFLRGEIELTARAKRAGEKIDNGQGGTITITPPPIPPDNTTGNDEYKDSDKDFHKDGRPTGTNKMSWSARVNYDKYGIAFDDFGKDPSTAEVVDRENGLLVDHLTEGTHFTPESLYVTVPVYIITYPEEKPAGSGDFTPKRMGDRQIGANYFLDGAPLDPIPQEIPFFDFIIEAEGGKNPDRAQFLLLEQEENETYEAFKTRVQNHPEDYGRRAYGVYKHEDNTETVLIAFGTLPGNKFYYEDLRETYAGHPNADIHLAIELDATLTPSQRTDLHRFYSKDGPSKGAIMAYDIGFIVDVDVPAYGDGWYHNDITFEFDGKEQQEAGADVDFRANWGEAEAGFLNTKKIVEGEENTELAEPRIFKFNIVDKVGNIVAYGRTEEEVTVKGKPFNTKFYKDENYMQPINNIDKDSPDHWSSILTENEWYYIKEVDLDGYEVSILNSKGEQTDRIQYVKGKEQRWNFVVRNIEPFRVEAVKKIVGEGKLSGKKEFKFELRDNRTNPPTVAAYGKTTVTDKNVETPIKFYLDQDCTKEITNWKKMEVDGQERTILENGIAYELVEIDDQGYEVTYSNKELPNGSYVSGATVTANHTDGGKIAFLVENKDTFHFGANKKIEGTGDLPEALTFEFELKDVATGSIVAYGKVDVGAKGTDAPIEFFTSADYAAANKITDWTAVLTEGKKYRLEETETHNYAPIYSGGSGADKNEFTVSFNNDPAITINTENRDTLDFRATKEVTGEGVFKEETFKFELLDGEDVVAHGRAEVTEKNSEVEIDFYTDPENVATKITDWTKVLTAGKTYTLKEVDDSGYAVSYTNQDSESTNQFVAEYTTGKVFKIKVTNKRDKVPLPQTGGEGYQQQLMLASGILLLIILTAGILEYRRRKVGA